MWCRRVQNRLSALADGELTQAEATAVQRHLVRCEACSREYSAIRRWVTLAAGFPEEELPTGFHNRLMTRLAETAQERWERPERVATVQRRSFIAPWIWAGCATGATAALAFGVIQARPEDKAAAPPLNPSIEAPIAPIETPPVARQLQSEPKETRLCRNTELPALSAHPAASRPPANRNPREAAGLSGRAAQDVGASKQSDKLTRPRQESSQPSTLPPSAPLSAPVPPKELLPHDAEIGSSSPGKPASELRSADSGSVTAQTPGSGIGANMDVLREASGVPVVNSVVTTPQPEPDTPAGERTPSTRMAGTSLEPEGNAVGQEDEGLLQFRSYLQENNSTVPQPPIHQRNRLDRRPRKL